MASAAPTSVEVARPEPAILLILVGLVASGKSTFAQALESHYPHFRRCNQDDLGNRREVENLARQCLQQGQSVCIDRTNFDQSQRAHWIRIAREFPGTRIWVLVFDTPYETCASRLRERKFHPTIKSVEEGLSVLSHFSSVFKPPTSSEGYNRILALKPSDHTSPLYTYEEITSILRRIRESPPVLHEPTNASSPPRGSHGFHGGSPFGPTGRGSPSQGVWRQMPQSTNNWRTSVVRGSASGFVDSAREQRTGTEPQRRINRTSIVHPTSMATPSRDELSGSVKNHSHSSDERGKSLAEDATIT